MRIHLPVKLNRCDWKLNRWWRLHSRAPVAASVSIWFQFPFTKGVPRASASSITDSIDKFLLRTEEGGRRKEDGGGRKEGGGELISTRFIKSEWWRVSDYVPTCPALICGDPRHDKSITINEWATRITCFQKCKVDWCTGTWGATGKREPRWLWLQ